MSRSQAHSGVICQYTPHKCGDRGRNRRHTFQCLLGPRPREPLGSLLVFQAVCSGATRWPSTGLCSLTVRNG